MEQDILISVIINCHNGDKYLRACIESVISQTYKNWELILWDNSSTDNSANIFNSYYGLPFKYYYNSSKVTLSKARNLAVGVATGEWVAFLDSDDYWLSHKLENQINLIKNSDSIPSFLYSKSLIVNSLEKANNSWSKNIVNSNKLFSFKKMPSGYIFDKLIFENFIPLSSALISKKKYFSNGPINENLKQAEDYDLFLKLSYNEIVLFSDSPQTVYRVHDNNLSGTQMELNYEEKLCILDLYKNHENYKNAVLSHIGCEIYSIIKNRNFKEISKFKINSTQTILKSLFYFVYYYIKIRIKK